MNRYFFVVILLSSVLQAMGLGENATQELKNIFRVKMDEKLVSARTVFALIQGADINVPIDTISKSHILHKIIEYDYYFLPFLLKHVKIQQAVACSGGLRPPFLDINCKDNLGHTPLHSAIKRNNVKIVELLLKEEQDTDVNCVNFEGRTPLHCAIVYGNIYISGLLLQRPGIDINKQDIWGNTSLHYATEMAFDEIVKQMIELGAHIDIENNQKKTPFDLIVEIILNKDKVIYGKSPQGYTSIFALVLGQKLLLDFAIYNKNGQQDLMHNALLALKSIVDNSLELDIENFVMPKNIS